MNPRQNNSKSIAQFQKTKCQEIICLFMGGETPNANHVRSRFLRDLKNINGNVHLFGVQPPAEI